MYTPKYQEMFDRSIGKLIDQGHKAMEEHHCVMQTCIGSRCAIGWLIPDNMIEDYTHGNLYEIAQKQAFCELWGLEPISKEIGAEEPEHMAFLRTLMYLHDGGYIFEPRKYLTVHGQEHFSRLEEFGVDTTALVAHCQRLVDKETL